MKKRASCRHAIPVLVIICVLALVLCGCGGISGSGNAYDRNVASDSNVDSGDTAGRARSEGSGGLADALRSSTSADVGSSAADTTDADKGEAEASSQASVGSSSADGADTFRVSDLEGFIAAIGPNRRIILEGDGILLVKADSSSETGFAPMPDASANPYVYWHPMGEALVIEGVENLSIRGGGRERFSLTSDSEWSPLINLSHCKNITLENISAGHTVGSTCSTPVFGIGSSEDITLRDCGLYGCGAVGLFVFEARGLMVEDSEIYDCSERLLEIAYASDIVFRRVNFHDTKGYRQIYIESSNDILFENCVFSANFNINYFGSGGLFYGEGSTAGVTVRHCEFIGNAIDVLDESGIARFEDCGFNENGFDNYGAVEDGVWVQMIEPWLEAYGDDYQGEYYGDDEY